MYVNIALLLNGNLFWLSGRNCEKNVENLSVAADGSAATDSLPVIS
jgi:hypothetical protein